jgi:hypothetical protein
LNSTQLPVLSKPKPNYKPTDEQLALVEIAARKHLRALLKEAKQLLEQVD